MTRTYNSKPARVNNDKFKVIDYLANKQKCSLTIALDKIISVSPLYVNTLNEYELSGD